ncbi:hypothetical protein [Alistipes sp. ZOR0009]|uniref:hypothetical protein n=1 Tax=Alistipes sp. ZOR0009 TaxID=1339253 RepID=UPI0012E06516|nr:hypothetical protein [Alistipes sp. ZOR0009]
MNVWIGGVNGRYRSVVVRRRGGAYFCFDVWSGNLAGVVVGSSINVMPPSRFLPA